jgi:hypothetical protein
MKRNFVIATVLALTVGLTRTAAGQTIDLSWSSIDGGGAMFTTGGNLELSGTIGQMDAGMMTGGAFELSGGFWAGMGVPCPADLNGDRTVGLADLTLLLSNFGSSGAGVAGDLDGDHDVDLGDLTQMLSAFGTTC